jgi:hypothetical protein
MRANDLGRDVERLRKEIRRKIKERKQLRKE